MNNTQKYKDIILSCLYKISKNNYILKPYNDFADLSNKIPDFENILEDLRIEGYIQYQHLSNGREYNIDNPLTQKGIEYCKSKEIKQ